MPTHPIFKLVISDGDKEAFSANLSYDLVKEIVSSFAYEGVGDDAFYLLAARHPAEVVRMRVAYIDTLPEEVCELLANDTSIDVLRALVDTTSFKEWASAGLIEALVTRDTEIAAKVARDIGTYRQVNVAALATRFAAHPDPAVVHRLAMSSDVPKKILKTLLTHADPSVAATARPNARG